MKAGSLSKKPLLRIDLIVCLATAIFLILFGIRQSIQTLIVLPSNSTIISIQERRIPSQEALQQLIDDEREALAFHETPAGWTNLSLALGLRSDAGNAKEYLAEARDALQHSLALEPANPYAWSRLATLDQALGADSQTVLAELRMAYATGPNETILQVTRLKLFISLWPELSPSDRNNAFSDSRGAWQHDRAQLLAVSADPFSLNVIRAALVTNLREWAAFEALRAAEQKKGH